MDSIEIKSPTERYKAIADAIREKNGTTELMHPADMPQAILDIVSGGGDSATEYIESTGTQYIDTGIVVKTGYKVVIDFQLTKEQRNKVVFGVVNGNNWESAFQCVIIVGFDERFGFEFSQKSLLERTTAYGLATRDYTNTAYLFGRNWEGNEDCVAMRLFNFTITNEKGEVIQWLIPAIDKDGVVCLYDKVTKTYFYNKGTGEFVSGSINSELENLETLIDNSGVLEDTEGSVEEKVEQLIEKAELENAMYMLSEGFERVQVLYDTEIEIFPRINLKNCLYLVLQNMKKLKRIDYYLNTEKLKTASNIFVGCDSLEYMKGFNTSKAAGGASCYKSCGKLKTIAEPFDVSSMTGTQNMFNYCGSLEDVYFVAESIKCDFAFPNSPKLSAVSIQSIAYGLAYVTTAQTVTFNKAFENDFEKLPAELRDLITNQKGWTLAFA